MPAPARHTLAVAAVLGAGVLLPVACGTSRSGLTAVEQSQLLGMIAQARAAAAAGNPAGAEASLASLRAEVSQLRLAGSLDRTRAARMQSVAAQAVSAARTQAAAKTAGPPAPATAQTPAAPTTTTTPPATATPPAAAGTGPAQIVVQGADALKNRVDQAVGKGVAKLKQRIDRLQQNLGGPGPGNGNGGGGGD